MENQYDIIILGGGPAGVTAALRAQELGAQVALVERSWLGGTCTNDGCVPTRFLAKTARLLRNARQYADFGLVGEPPTLDFSQLLARTQDIVYTIHEKKQLLKHLESSGAHVLTNTGEARFKNPHTIVLKDGTQLQAEKFIICVGGHARQLDFPGAEYALTHSDVWSLRNLPKRVAIVGAAATGCQLASIFSDFGSQVWLLDIAPRILPAEDPDVSQKMQQAFEKKDIHVITGMQGLLGIEKVSIENGNPEFGDNDDYLLAFTNEDNKRHLEVDAVILAVGWPGNIERLNLEAAGVLAERGFISVNQHLGTSAPHIYAAGDITGRMMLVQSAGYEARIAAENAVLGDNQRYGHYIVPHGGFTDPEYGSVGMTEIQAQEVETCAVATISYSDLDRAVIDGYTQGFCKLIVSKENRKVLGAHVVGEQAVEVVQLIAAGMAADIRVEQLAEVELAYPTYTAIVGLAARRLVAELDATPLTPQWRALERLHVAEWERSDDLGPILGSGR